MAKAQLRDCSDSLKMKIFKGVTTQKHPLLLPKLNEQVMSMHDTNQHAELKAAF